MWKLKKTCSPFEMVDGPMDGRKFDHGTEYAEIPSRYAGSFEHTGESIIETMGQNGAQEFGSPTGRKIKKEKEEVADA